MKKYRGVIIEESLRDKKVLDSVNILSTKAEQVTPRHQTPDLQQWAFHHVEVDARRAMNIARDFGKSLRNKWYADFDNGQEHYIIFQSRVFKIDMKKQEQYDEARAYDIALGIPEYQVDFHPKVRKWER